MTDRPRVLVTGGGGYVAGWCIVELVRAGYRVRTTMRSRDKEAALRRAIATCVGSSTATSSRAIVGGSVGAIAADSSASGSSGAAADRSTAAPAAGSSATGWSDAIEVVIADLTDDAGWDAAMAGCAYVLHVASPLSSRGDPTEVARDGTLRVLRAATRAGVRRVVMTSAAATARLPRGATGVADETVWSDADDPRFDGYRRSKIHAEKAAWAYMREAGGATELTTILPGAVFGPAVAPGPLGSLQIIQRMLAGKLPGVFQLAFWIVDVRDLAALHVRAMTAPDAANQRFLATGEMMWMADIARTLRDRLGDDARKVPTRRLPSWLVRGMAWLVPLLRGLVPELGRRNDVTSAKAQRVLGFAPRPAADTIADSGRYLLGAT